MVTSFQCSTFFHLTLYKTITFRLKPTKNAVFRPHLPFKVPSREDVLRGLSGEGKENGDSYPTTSPPPGQKIARRLAENSPTYP